MSFYGLNRAAINAGVASFVAGAALVVAASTVEATATRVVLPESSVVISSNAAATGFRNVFGGSGFVVELNSSAFPALLQLQSADIHVGSALKATYTNAWINPVSQLEASGFITRPGTGVSEANFTATALPKLDVGFASNLVGSSAASADASVKRSGNTTVDRDGYAKQAIVSGLTANGLKTALGYASPEVFSTAYAEATKIHGGSVDFVSVLQVGVVASTDAAICTIESNFTAHSLLTQAGEASSVGFALVSSEGTITQHAEAKVITVELSAWALGELALLSNALSQASSDAIATGTIVKLAEATSEATSAVFAQWSMIVGGAADVVVTSSLTGMPLTNAEAPDPESRTMRRVHVDRVMHRPFVNRVMRRQA